VISILPALIGSPARAATTPEHGTSFILHAFAIFACAKPQGMRTNHLLLWLVVVAVIAAIAHQSGRFDVPSRRGSLEPGATISGRAKTIDGDSLELAGERIRLFGIDAPEARQQCRNAQGQDYPCGREAARALAALANGQLSCTLMRQDQYERGVATCTANGRDLGDAMVRAGHARDYVRHSRGRYAEAEREARAARRGIWAGDFEQPEAWRRREMR
jgi:endonuclease YncB( thermonuclease family)